jgi:nickel/cobalt transporter (NicO) family protein
MGCGREIFLRLRDILFAVLLCLAPAEVRAHPHVWVDAAAEVLFDDKGRIAAIRHHWRFDEGFSAYALQGLDTDRDGKYSPQELEPLAQENVESLKDFDFFTFLSVGDYQAGFSAPKDYFVDLMDDRLVLHFTLPLSTPLLTRAKTVLEVGDPEYYVAFSLPSIEAVRLDNAPAACRLVVHPARELDAAAAATLAEIGPDVRDLPPDMQALAAGTENSADITCGAPVPPASAGDAVSAMAGADAPGDLTALPAEASSSEVAETAPAETVTATTGAEASGADASIDQQASTPAPSRSPGLMRRWTIWIGVLQTQFNRDLTAGLKAFRDGGAFWWLGGVSFLYGIVHAAGPGHGKVVISSYLVANEARIRRGVVIAFISAFVQAVVAVGLIGVLAVVLNMTSMAIDSTAKIFEAGSFALVAAVGVYLLVRKGRAAWSVMQGGDPHAHHHHHHGHEHDASPSPLRGGARGGVALAPPSQAALKHPRDHQSSDHTHKHNDDCGRHPAPNPSPQGGGERAGGLAGAAAAIVSVGIRPCTGALVVLVFALSQGVFWAGVASTFVMALGTALTVALLAALAVGAKDLAKRLAGGGDGRLAAQVMLGLELAAAALITLMGAVLFVGTIAA